MLYRRSFASNLQTQKLVNLICVCLRSCQYFCESLKGTKTIPLSLGHLYTLFPATYVQFAYFYAVRKNWWVNLRKIWLNFKKISVKLKKILALIFENYGGYTKIVKNYTELQKILTEGIWKKSEIVSVGFSEILKNVSKKQKHSS